MPFWHLFLLLVSLYFIGNSGRMKDKIWDRSKRCIRITFLIYMEL